MSKVLILSANRDSPFDEWRHGTAFLLKHSAELDSFGQHRLTEDPVEADIILFAEMGMCGQFAELVRAHPYYRRFPQKCFLFDSGDLFFPSLRGIYASLRIDQYCPGYTRTGFYIYLVENPFIVSRPCSGKEEYLASFVGSQKTHSVRKGLFEFDRSDIYVKDTSADSYRITYHGDPAERAKFWAEYADAIANAKFSLCPRGRGAGSIRLYESMKMGRACVILSDDWHADEDIAWDEFSIRIAERDVANLPEILDRNANRAVEMGARARQVWEEKFSESVRFHRVTEMCLDMQGHGGRGGWPTHMRTLRRIANPRNLRNYLMSKKFLYRNNRKVYW